MQIVSRQFARNAKSYFLEKIRKKHYKMSSAELPSLQSITNQSIQIRLSELLLFTGKFYSSHKHSQIIIILNYILTNEVWGGVYRSLPVLQSVGLLVSQSARTVLFEFMTWTTLLLDFHETSQKWLAWLAALCDIKVLFVFFLFFFSSLGTESLSLLEEIFLHFLLYFYETLVLY